MGVPGPVRQAPFEVDPAVRGPQPTFGDDPARVLSADKADIGPARVDYPEDDKDVSVLRGR